MTKRRFDDFFFLIGNANRRELNYRVICKTLRRIGTQIDNKFETQTYNLPNSTFEGAQFFFPEKSTVGLVNRQSVLIDC